MPSDEPDNRRRRTNTRVIHLVADADTPGAPGVDDTDVSWTQTTVDVDDDPALIGRMAASLLAGDGELRTTAPRTALRVRAVVDRLLAARADLDPTGRR